MSASSSIVADRSLAPEGHRKIRWVEQHAPVLNAAFERYLNDGTLRGQNVAVCVPLEAKTAYRSSARTYSNMWVLRLDNSGQARQFTEWWMEHPKK